MAEQVPEDVKHRTAACACSASSSASRRDFNARLPGTQPRGPVREARTPSWPARRSIAISADGAGQSAEPASGSAIAIGDVAAVTITASSTNSLFGALAATAPRRQRRIAGGTGRLEPIAHHTVEQWNPHADRPMPDGCRDDPDRARLRRQPARLAAVRAIRAEPRVDRAPARRGRRSARQPRHHRGLARRLRAGAPRARGPLRALKRGDELIPGDVEGAIRLAIAQGSLFDFDPAAARPSFEEINLRKRPVRARTAAQDAYIRALKRHALVFGTGPAGTGKTWLAVAHAIAAVRAQGGRPHHPVAAGGGSRRAARLPARRHAREGRSLSATDLRRAVRPDGCPHRRARAAVRRDRDRAARLHARPHPVQCRGHPRRGAEHDRRCR